MASNTVSDFTEDEANEGASKVEQQLQDATDRLVSLSEKITVCNALLNDLKALSDIVVNKALQHASLPPRK